MKFVKFFSSMFFSSIRNAFKRLSPLYFSRSYSAEKFQFSEQNVVIKTCGNVYKQWKIQNLYSILPDGDLEFKVPFIDTQHNSKTTSLPIVLALHGAPGTWKDLSLLISYLHQCGYRVIAPSFPNFHMYRPGIFRHSDVEKAQYLEDFLKEISVSHVDHLICHSGASLCGLVLCLNGNLGIKSLSLFNPVTYHEILMRTNVVCFKLLAKAAENPFLLKFMEICGPFVMNRLSPMKVESMLDPLLSATTVVNGNVVKCKDKYLQLKLKKLPIFFAFSENDPLIYVKSSYALAELLGAKASEIFIHDKGGALVQKGTSTPFLKVIAFQEGSHYVFLKHAEIIHRELKSFLQSQQKSN